MDEQLEELWEHARATRSGLRAADRSLRHLRQLLAGLEERLDEALAAQPNGGTANGKASIGTRDLVA